MQQNKAAILCTRPIDESLVKYASTKGVTIDIIQFIRTEPISSVEVQQEIEQTLLLPATVVFTSMNAVEAVATELNEQNPGWKIYCTGNTTRQLVQKYFGDKCIAGTADNAVSLAELILNNKDIDEVFFFCGDQRRDELPAILRRQNIEVIEIVVYQTIAVPQQLDKDYNGILFFSPTAVESFFRNNKAKDNTVLFAIGNTTANEIKKYLSASPSQASAGKTGKTGSENKIIVSDEPGIKDLLEKAIHFFHINPIHY